MTTTLTARLCPHCSWKMLKSDFAAPDHRTKTRQHLTPARRRKIVETPNYNPSNCITDHHPARLKSRLMFHEPLTTTWLSHVKKVSSSPPQNMTRAVVMRNVFDQGWWQQRWLHDLAPERHLYPPGTSYLWRNCGDTSLQVHVAGPYQATPWYRHVVFTDELETKREKAMEKNRNWKGCTYVYDSIKLAPNKRETSATMGETKITAYIHEVEKMHAALPRSTSWNPARSQHQQAAEKMLRYDLWLLKT